MSGNPGAKQLRPAPMLRPFPEPGRGLLQCYRELDLALNGTKEQQQALGNLRMLPRPWEPSSVRHPLLRHELWVWLEAAVTWHNIEYVWDVSMVIPACWPEHPHLVHEIAVLTDQRHRAGLSLTSDHLEEWHRYALPAFTERMRARTKTHCEDGHQEWPARGRFSRHVAEDAVTHRREQFARDEAGLQRPADPSDDSGPRLRVVEGDTPPSPDSDEPPYDPHTGEVLD